MKACNQSKVLEVLPVLRPFINPGQLCAMADGVRGEESDWFTQKFLDLAALIAAMPKTYEQDDKGDAALVSLHYFKHGMDWFITERDVDTDSEGQWQAFGLADLGHGGELGYISLPELLENGVELDLHYEPRTLGQVKAELAQAKPATIDTRATCFARALRAVLTHIEQKAKSQFRYNEDVNLPEGRMEAADTLAHALTHGMASGWNTYQGWSCDDAKSLAHAVLEDANCHQVAARIYMKADALAA